MNGLGLGHLTRLLAIAIQLKRINPNCEILFVTTSEADNVLNRFGIPYVHLPSKKLAGTGTIGAKKLARIYNALINPLLDNWQPHIFITDTQVTGSLNDTLHYLRYSNSYKVFIHRSRKPESYTQAQIQSQRFYHLIVAPHYPHQFLVPEPFGFEVPVFWSGPVLLKSKEESPMRDAVRRELKVQPNEVLIFLSLGGGGDDSDPEIFEKVLPVLNRFQNIKILLAKGLLSTYSLTGTTNNLIVTSIFPVSDCFAGVDIAISAAGYNTFHELMHHGVPTIFIPRERGWDDQYERAKQAEDKGACMLCAAADIDSKLQNLAELILKSEIQTEMRLRAKNLVPENNAARAANEILTGYFSRIQDYNSNNGTETSELP
jgi:predicted glycosyltransferase